MVENKIQLHNTLSRRKELFIPLKSPFVGLYVCGPTVYGDPHLGHSRSAITFDLLFRLLKYEGYKVRYVRNITDVGHLVGDADGGEDKIAKKARLEQLEPMEVAQYYTNRYEHYMSEMGCLSPSIEPRASGHIIEQIALAKDILDRGLAYLSNGSVYFDVLSYAKSHDYGVLSGRNLDELQSGGRSEDYVSEKRFEADFALWKKADQGHIMQWPSPWGMGFPGWHAECTAMSRKYLGEQFDIHGGGLDLVFPHHECEIAQSMASVGTTGARYWVHNNMITLNGQKMGKSLGNSISLDEFFTGSSKQLTQAYSPMTIRFFILQAHYRSTLDFSNEALQASQRGFLRLVKGWSLLRGQEISPELLAAARGEENDLLSSCLEALRDDMNSPVAIAYLFDSLAVINSWDNGKVSLSKERLAQLRVAFDDVLGELLGLEVEASVGGDKLGVAMELLLAMRQRAKESKDWKSADEIRDRLLEAGLRIKDRKDGADWELE
ncbi:MAG: cysteine--tRNA ligase [Mucinivorans sp.]